MKIELNILARHFDGARFINPCNCAISKAAKDHFGTDNVSEGVSGISVEEIRYNHELYTATDFYNDQEKAAMMQPNEVVRTIILEKQ